MPYMGNLKLSTAANKTILMVDSSDHITGKTGLAAGITKYITKAAGTPAATTITTTELDATNVKGIYKLAFADSDVDTLGDFQLHLTAAGADPADYWWTVTTRVLDDLAFPATSGRSMVVDASGLVDANMVKMGPTGAGTAQTARDIGASVLLSSGTGTGQLDFTSGVVKANLVQILGTALTETAGQIAAAFKQFFNIASPTSTMNTITTVTTTTNLTNAPTNGDLTSTMKTSVQTAADAAVTANSSVVAIKAKTDLLTFDSDNNIDADVIEWKGATAPAMTGDAFARIGVNGAGLTALGDTRIANLDATVSSRLADSDFIAPDNAGISAIKAQTDKIAFDSDNYVLSHPMTAVSVTLDSDDLASITNSVWDEPTTGHQTAGTTGKALTDAGSAGDPWSTVIPGAYTSDEAGYIVGNFLDTTISSRLPTSSYTAPDNANIGLIKAQTDKLTFDSDNYIESHPMTGVTVTTNNDKTGYTASTVSDKTGYALTSAYDPAKTASQDSDMQTALTDLATIPTATENADALLKRDWTSVTGEAARSVLNAMRFVRNKFSTTANAGFVTVYKEDDTTQAYTKPLTTDSDAAPIVEG